MDQPLKQRLIGVTIAVALVVIFVPMLFDKSDDKGKLSTTGIPPIPDEVLEKPLELPKTAEDIAVIEKERQQALEKEQAKVAQESGKKPAVESTYKIVPLNEEAPSKLKENEPSAQTPSQDEEGGEAVSTENVEEEGKPNEVATPTTNPPPKPVAPPPIAHPVTAPKHAVTPVPKTQFAGESHAPNTHPKAQTPLLNSKPVINATTTRTPETTVKTKSPEATKPVESHPATIKTVKVNRPKPAAAVQELDDEGEPIPTPAPAKTAAKPRPATAISTRPAQPAVAKKPVAAEPRPPAANSEPAAEPNPAATPAKPPAKPAAAPQAAKPITAIKKPTTWVVQAGSFTDETSAKTLAEKLKQSKFPASVQTSQGEHGPVYRVQVGAAHNRSHAEETLKQIQGSTGISGVVTPRH